MPHEDGRRSPLILLAVGLGALLVSAPGLACGGGSTPEAPAPAANVIDTFDFGFDAETVTIKTGTTLTWENTGATIHNVEGRGFFSDSIAPGASYEHTFRTEGTYRFVCTLHPTLMSGEVVVS